MSHKPQPFGSTAKRFSTGWKSQFMPAPGSYEVEPVLCILIKIPVQKPRRVATAATEKIPVFGTAGERFIYKKPTAQPGPGAYSISLESAKKPKSAAELKAKTQRLFTKVDAAVIKPALHGVLPTNLAWLWYSVRTL
jgi:Sperm-tail PG-rich repeat